MILGGPFLVPPIAKATFIRSRVARNRKTLALISQNQRTPWHHLMLRSVQPQACPWNQQQKEMSQHNLSIGKLCSPSGLVVYIRSFQCMGAGLLETGITTSCWATAWGGHFLFRELCVIGDRLGSAAVGCRIFDQKSSRKAKRREWYGFQLVPSNTFRSNPYLLDAARFQSHHNRCGNCLQRCAVASTVAEFFRC